MVILVWATAATGIAASKATIIYFNRRFIAQKIYINNASEGKLLPAHDKTIQNPPTRNKSHTPPLHFQRS
jgi:hypothetical protein